MAKDVKIAGATFTAVPAVLLPTPEGGLAKFVEESEVSGDTSEVDVRLRTILGGEANE